MAVRTSFTAGEVLAAADLTDTFGAKLNLAGGKVLQVVRATDSTTRSTSSTSFVDASISVTITPQRSTSAIILIWAFWAETNAINRILTATITDSSNNAISGAEAQQIYSEAGRLQVGVHLFGYATPGTTSAITYKGRFRASAAGAVDITNASRTGQLYAIEVSA